MNHSNSSVILIIPSASYRAKPFMHAAVKIGINILVITNNSQVFSEYYPENVITMNFEHWRESIENIRKWSEQYDLKEVI